jgi:hypothetical protein
MRKAQFVAVCAVMSGLVSLVSSRGEQSQSAPAASAIRVGTFDSRAIAVAFAGSKSFNDAIRKMMDEHKKAKAAGDEKRVKELEAEGAAGQALMHRQGFGTASVANILEHVKDKLPAVAERAGVEVIVSKWDVVYRKTGVQPVDVTDAMVALFEPNERVLAIVKDMKDKPPLTLKEIEEGEEQEKREHR